MKMKNKDTDNVAYVCKFDGKCEITVNTRKRCQKCRYEKCLKVGMKTEQVLNEKEKEFRFRRLLESKKKVPNAPKKIKSDEKVGDKKVCFVHVLFNCDAAF